MARTLAKFKTLTNAEDYLEFFDFAYDPQFVNVNRLHILQKFASLLKAIEADSSDLSESERLDKYQAALQEAYNTFTTSSPLTEKLFKVLQTKPQNVVLLSDVGAD